MAAQGLFVQHPELGARHEELKAIRDKHIAHSADNGEHVGIVIAAENVTGAAQGIGVRNWFFAGDGPEALKGFLELVEFVAAHLAAEELRLGNEVAKLVMGEGATWEQALQAFGEATSFHHPVYGPTKGFVYGKDDELA